MSESHSVPRSPDEVTEEWLASALREWHPEARVASVEVVDVQHGTNSNARLRVAYEGPSELPETYFLKLPPLDPEFRKAVLATGMGLREARFYRNLARTVPMRVPRPYVARFDAASGDFLLLIEDLAASPGCGFPDVAAGIRFEQAAEAMRDFAALHVRYEDSARLAREAGWVERMPRGSTFGATLLKIGLEHHRERLTDAFAELARLYIDQQSVFEDSWERGSTTLLQGDTHIGNLFEDGGHIGFLDWGLIQLGTPMRDVGYFISMTLSPTLRRKHERELIERYLEARLEIGGTPIDFDDAWQLHRLHATYAVPAACPIVTFPEDQSEESERLSVAFLERSECVIEDLDARGALRDAMGI